ncbi:beta-ketoacyl-[acyl-carrier-protein] synthase family protein [Pseudonocardia sp. RS11V-5]|uniref:beta-ketoacyl-[acyl-carrier-protein] synthase family protein n=1 Tax=Pseudonocardia terrae TaxID=2905831 RepID=UPI001E2E7A93|nr:beta-ketoacyl-[acyl-carrier-protein] synthase family protein [Pseudonocardia terrae]MCE3551499.1 beta-ketoacyl-[acyl-carrier-protein] synthase family protein [Pseudonocardia terrae]
MSQIVVTGAGIVSPLGSSVETFLAGLADNEVATRPSPWRDAEGMPLGWWAGVPDFDPDEWADARVQAGSDLFTLYALAAAQQAVTQAGLAELDPLRTAVVHGSSMGGMRALMRAQHDLERSGPGAIDRKTMIKIWPNMAAAQIAMRWDLHGPSLTVCTACASALDAIGTATALLKAGRADVAIVGGTEGGMPLADGRAEGEFVPATVHGQTAYGMSDPTAADRLLASIPFDVRRSGIVTGEGSAMVILETAEHSRARGATPLAEIAGFGSLSDSYHPSSPEPTGRWEALVMRQALDDAGETPDRVDMVVAHATATPKGDTAEIHALNDVHEGRTRPLPVTALKGHTGHTGASSGAMNLIVAMNAMDRGWLPNVAGTSQVDPLCRFDVVTGKPADVTVDLAQVNAFGFGGQDASLVVRRLP